MTHPALSHISFHAVYDASILEALEYARDNGFAGVQVAAESPHLAFDYLSSSEVSQIYSFVQSQNLCLSFHAPDEGVSLFQHSRSLRDGIVNYYRSLFDFASAAGARLVTIHIGSMPTFRTDTRREITVPDVDRVAYREIVSQNLDGVLEANRSRLTVCVESYALDEFSLFLLKPYVDSGSLAFSWDIAKTWNNTALERFFFSNLAKVKQVHLHDVRTDEKSVQRSHCVIGSGEIDFASYLARLANADILDYCIEVRPREKARESLDALKGILGVE